MSNPIPEKIVNYNVYDDTNKLVAVTGEVTLPNLEPLTETVSGAGILGEYDSVSVGHFGPMSVEIQFRALLDKSFDLQRNKNRSIVLRAAQQSYDLASGVVSYRGLKITLKGQPKGLNPGKIGVNVQTETTSVLEVIYMKVELDGKVLLELDKINFIYKLNGEDQRGGMKKLI